MTKGAVLDAQRPMAKKTPKAGLKATTDNFKARQGVQGQRTGVRRTAKRTSGVQSKQGDDHPGAVNPQQPAVQQGTSRTTPVAGTPEGSHTLGYLGLGVEPTGDRSNYDRTDFIVLMLAVTGLFLLGLVIGDVIGRLWH